MPPPPRTNSRGGSGEVNIRIWLSKYFRFTFFLQILGKTIKNKISKLSAKIFGIISRRGNFYSSGGKNWQRFGPIFQEKFRK